MARKSACGGEWYACPAWGYVTVCVSARGAGIRTVVAPPCSACVLGAEYELIEIGSVQPPQPALLGMCLVKNFAGDEKIRGSRFYQTQ